MAMRHVILGAGPAGLAALQTIRSLEPGAEITLVCDEPGYARMVLPYFIEGKIEERAVMTADDAWCKELGATARIGTRAQAIDTGAHALRLADGSALPYDRLLVATGSRAALPPIEGIDGEGIVTMWTLDDAKQYLGGETRETVIIGAGFIAFTVLDAIVARSERVHFVEIEPQILPRMLDRAAAEAFEHGLAERGIQVHKGSAVERIEQVGGRRRLHVAGGTTLDADAVVVATGIQPNLEVVAGSGIETDHGILVDETLRTSAPDVYAAGDIAQGLDLLTGERRVQAIQPTATDHGRIAGANMTGAGLRYAGSLTMNILAAQGLEAASFGLWDGAGHECTVVDNGRNSIYRKYVWEDDKLVGGILVGPTLAVSGTNDVGMLKGLVQTGLPLGPWRAYLEENPLDLRRVFVASGAAKELLGSTLLAGRFETTRPFRFPPLPARRARKPHHEALVSEAPR